MSHRRYARFRVCSTIAMSMCSAVTPSRAHAQFIVEDPWNLGYNIAQYVKQLYQVEMQVQQLTAQIQDMTHLSGFPTRDVEMLLNDANVLLGQPGSLGYASPGIGGTFQSYFTPTQVLPPQQWVPAQQARAQAAVNVMQAAVVATSQQQQATAPGEATIAQMKQMNSGLVGQQQALELQNTAAIYSAEELMLLRQATMLQTNLQAVYYANQIAREAQRDTAITTMLTTLAAPVPPPQTISLIVMP
jgi:P-type conjugative transfer protein TrbJ